MKSAFSRIGLCCVLVFGAVYGVFSQESEPEPAAIQKFALVIGNGNYANVTKLINPVNDADDIAVTLWELGFTVDLVKDGNLQQMEDGVSRLKGRLSDAKNTYGFFFYAGHGVQSNGENFLLPVNANIPSESYLRDRAISVQAVLDELNQAGNELNIVVLDACRDNPFSWNRSGSRGLTLVNHQPADSILVFATSAGSTAADGEGRNGLFTSKLLNNLRTPGLDASEVFRLTGADVAQASNRQQIPAIYNQFFGVAYLGNISDIQQSAAERPAPVPLPSYSGRAGGVVKESRLWTVGASLGTSFADPWFIGTLRGTIAPFNYTFVELGFDLGLGSGDWRVEYYSLYPYAHFAYYRPYKDLGGWYAGGGIGYMTAEYKFREGTVTKNAFGFDITAGVNLWDMLNVSYTFRTNFEFASNKISVGYTYRFK